MIDFEVDNNYIVLYPSLLGGEMFTTTLADCVPSMNPCHNSLDEKGAVITRCLTHFAEGRTADNLINKHYKWDKTKGVICRDHINTNLNLYETFTPRFKPILLTTTSPEMWWEKRNWVLYRTVYKKDVTIKYLKTNIDELCDTKFLRKLKRNMPDVVLEPDIFTYWFNGECEWNQDHRTNHIHYIRGHLASFEAYRTHFADMISINIDNVYRNLPRLTHDVKQHFPQLDTELWEQRWEEWRERNNRQ